jgi:hypothetical protein
MVCMCVLVYSYFVKNTSTWYWITTHHYMMGALQHGEEDDELAADLGTPPAGVVTPGAGFPEPTPGSVPVVLPEGWARRTLMAGIVHAARVSRVVMLFKQWKTGHNTRLVSSKNSLFSLSCVWVLSAGEYRWQPSSVSLVRGDKNKNSRRNGERGLGLDERTGGEDSSDEFGVARGE